MQNFQCYPAQAQYANSCALPQVNAVKIDINNPQAYGGKNSDGQTNPIAPANNCPYNYPYASMYSMPTVGQYVTPNAYPQPPIPTVVPPVVQPQQPTVAVVPEVQKPAIQTQAAPTVIPVPVPVAPVPVPAVPAPTPNQPLVNAPVNQQVTVNSQPVPPAVADVKQTTTDANNAKPVEPIKPVEPKAAETNVDVNGILTALSSTNADDQTAAIQRIAEIAQTNPVAAKGLLNDQVFGKLTDIINADTSKLEGPKGAPDPKNLSPLEKAEINKQFAVYTLAILQKNFREEINQLMKKNNLPDIAI
ncbi:MAG: hypothetical protein MJ180_01105, partial [Candidatus Gastranaerophilales bacterium]|nr:hypothetical protein [Candidatus Gastranaerophilales bacterium]